MDNGLIFPYPRTAVQAETVMLSLPLIAFGREAVGGPIG